MNRLSFLIVFIFLSLQVIADDLIPLPDLTYRVTDLTETLNQQQKSSLEQILENFQTEKGSEIIIVIIPTTGDETIEDYTIRLAEEWKVGRENIDDGIILLIAKNDRKIRIEVGYGLEKIIPDAKASQIIQNTITPNFKNGDFYVGIDIAILEIINLIKAGNIEEVALTTPSDYTYKEPNNFLRILSSFIGIYVIVGLILMYFICRFLRKKIKKWSLLVLPLAFFLLVFGICSVFEIEFGDFEAGHIAGGFAALNFIICVFSLPYRKNVSSSSGSIYTFTRRSSTSKSYKPSSYSSRSISSSYKSSGSSSSSSSKKYSGGGGSFGGGGATGSW